MLLLLALRPQSTNLGEQRPLLVGFDPLSDSVPFLKEWLKLTPIDDCIAVPVDESEDLKGRVLWIRQQLV